MAALEEDSTAGLLRDALGGDQAAYHRFLQDITPVIRGIVRVRLASVAAQSVEDAVQDTLLAVHAKRHTWQQDQAVLPWVYAIARYKAIDALRKCGVHERHTPIEDVHEELIAVDSSPARDMDVDSAVAQLDGRVQQVVRAMGIEGVSVSEAGDRFGMSDNAVRVAFHRGLVQLVKLRPRLMGERLPGDMANTQNDG